MNSIETDRLLVVAPKNAFGAWDEQLSECLGDNSLQFVRLRGGVEKIERALRDNPRFCIITYQQYPRVAEQLIQYIRRNSVFMFLDESHRIKSGRSGISAESILKASFLPKRKLIMSGTPMPQSLNDILPTAFAVVREAAKRVIGQRHYDVQMIAGIVLIIIRKKYNLAKIGVILLASAAISV